MSEKEFIDFKKEFEEFKKELENSNPLFDDELIEFNDFDNLIFDSKDENNSMNLKSANDFLKSNEINESYPNISIDTEDISMILTIKKDYSDINDLTNRKNQFFKDLKDFIDEFESTEESDKLMKFYE